MEQTPLSLQPHEILVVKAVEPLHVVLDIWRVLYRVWYLSDHANPPASPLQPGDQLIVTHVSPEAMTPVERLNRQGEQVTLVSFGTFGVQTRAARNARNPRTGQAMWVPSRKTPTFSVGKRLRQVVQ
jgi:nucleoid DNA-binding protein